MPKQVIRANRYSNKMLSGIVRDPKRWYNSPGWDFWCVFGNSDLTTTMSSSNDGGSGYGWTFTGTLTTTAGDGDFLSKTDNDSVGALNLSTDGDNFVTPVIFGSYDHGLMAAEFLGSYPTTMTIEVCATYTGSTEDNFTYFGMFDAATTVANTNMSGWTMGAGGLMAHRGFGANNNFSAPGNADVYKIIYYNGNVWGQMNSSAYQNLRTIREDVWPHQIKFTRDAGAANSMRIHYIRVYYSNEIPS